ncbi:MAG: T9SS type A sorting domain-containing protein [Ignavibacteriota bacterium]
MKRIINFLIFIFLFVFQTMLSAQTTYTAILNGPWENSNTWSPAGIPGPSDFVKISMIVEIWGSHEIAGFELSLYGSINFKGTNNPSLTVTGNSTWSSGSFNGGNGGTNVNNSLLFTETSVLTIIEDTLRRFHHLYEGTYLTNLGTIKLQGTANLGIRGLSILKNEGIFDVMSDADFGGESFSGGTFLNTGTFRKSGGSDITSFNGWWTFENQGGTIDVQTGTLEYTSNGTLNGGTYNLAESGTLSLKGGIWICSDTLKGSPEGMFQLNGATISTDSANVVLDIQGTGFQFVYGTINGGGTLTIPEDALFVLPGTNYAGLRGGTTLLNQGTVQMGGTFAFGIQGYSFVENQSLWDITSDADFSGGTGSGGTFTNTGTFRKSGGSDVTTINAWWVFKNNSGGIIDVASGTLDFTNLDNAQSAIIQGIAAINVPSNFTNNGITAPGNSTGVLSYIGNFLPSATAVLDVQLGGVNEIDYDKLNVTGSAKLNGTLKVYLTNGFIPSAGDSFVVLTTASTITDSFVTVNSQSGLYLTLKKNSNNVTLVVDSVGTISSVENNSTGEIPTRYELSQNFPNPFNPSTNIQFSLPQTGFVKLEIFSITGERVDVLISEELGAGKYNYEWNGSNLSSGIYLYRLSTGSFVETRKMLLLK